MRTVIFDLDGTLCDVDHRRKYVTSEPKNWDAFNKACVLDEPNRHVLMLHNTLLNSGEYHIMYFSGRAGEYWSETVSWLVNTLGKPEEWVEARLRMRAPKDRRPDNIVKLEMLQAVRKDGYDVVFSVDDRNQVVDMWRENGVPCFQCAPGDF